MFTSCDIFIIQYSRQQRQATVETPATMETSDVSSRQLYQENESSSNSRDASIGKNTINHTCIHNSGKDRNSFCDSNNAEAITGALAITETLVTA